MIGNVGCFEGMLEIIKWKLKFDKQLERSGCIKKSSGSVRCWCYGQSNCNSPQNMIKLYDAFKTGDPLLLDEVIDDIETSDFGSEGTSVKSSTVRYTTENVKNKSSIPHIFAKDNHKVALEGYLTSTSSISNDSDQINQNHRKEQTYGPNIRQPIKGVKVLQADDKLNETAEYSSTKHSRNQNERKIRHKEVAGSGMALHRPEVLRDIIALLLIAYIML
uniref:Post-SET domain-containing protein n=1 Tax=Elaeophora elaphi TaxID=1147741 RepID=A0A0R3RGT6_9BILA